jgi:hypothetical protein
MDLGLAERLPTSEETKPATVPAYDWPSVPKRAWIIAEMLRR